MVYDYDAEAGNSIFVERKSKKKRLAAAFGCSCCIFILGIVCLVLAYEVISLSRSLPSVNPS
jgi:hypothetical protein